MSCYLPLIEQNALLKEEIRILREELKEKEESEEVLVRIITDMSEPVPDEY
jgi:hypothetical protein